MKRFAKLGATLGLSVSLGVPLGACQAPMPYDDIEVADVVVSDGPLGGEALAQRMTDMRRSYRDMVHFHATLSTLADRKDSKGIQLFDRFMAEYMGNHLEPLLRGDWQATHPEVASLDASLRLAKAEILVQMRYPRGVQQILDDLETRYRGRDDLLVDYPLGRQGTLGDGLEILRDRKWSG